MTIVYSFSSSSSVSKIAPKTPVNVISADSSFLEINFLWYNVAISSSNFWILVNSALKFGFLTLDFSIKLSYMIVHIYY